MTTPSRQGKHEPSTGSYGSAQRASTAPTLGRSSPGWQPLLLREPWGSKTAVSHAWQDLCSALLTLLWARHTGNLDSQAKTPYSLLPGLGFWSFLALLRESLLSFRAQSHTSLPLRCGSWCQLLSQPPASASFVTAPRSVPHFDSSLLLSHVALMLGLWVVLSDSSAVLPLFFLPKACWSHFP